jgi:hypothetical protein
MGRIGGVESAVITMENNFDASAALAARLRAAQIDEAHKVKGKASRSKMSEKRETGIENKGNFPDSMEMTIKTKEGLRKERDTDYIIPSRDITYSIDRVSSLNMLKRLLAGDREKVIDVVEGKACLYEVRTWDTVPTDMRSIATVFVSKESGKQACIVKTTGHGENGKYSLGLESSEVKTLVRERVRKGLQSKKK